MADGRQPTRSYLGNRSEAEMACLISCPRCRQILYRETVEEVSRSRSNEQRAGGWKSPLKHETDLAVEELTEWIRRRVRLYYWKQWKQPRTRRRRLIKLGTDPAEVHMRTRSRKGYCRMSAYPIVQQTVTNRHLDQQGVPNLRTLWIRKHYGPKARV
jgi:hypothetical protein